MKASNTVRSLLLALPLMLLGCSGQGPNITATINQSASSLGNLPENPLQWRVITSSLNINDSTMSTLYGNDAAVDYARSHAEHDYPSASALSLVTWTQTDDDRWFGAKIPDHVKSVEFVFVKAAADGSTYYSYEKYEGSPLKLLDAQQSLKPKDRAASLMALRAAVMP